MEYPHRVGVCCKKGSGAFLFTVNKDLKILGDGQIWDLKGVSAPGSRKTFEDLFSGRALGEMAKAKRVFCRFKEKGKITGLSVTRALLSNEPQAKKQAKIILEGLAKNGALGIEALTKGKGFKNWSRQKRNYWKNIDIVVIGGGVSEGKTGGLLVNLIKKYLSKNGFAKIKVYQARFAGKEAGVLGAVINIIKLICKEAKTKGLKTIAGMGLDLGRDEIGVGLLAINPGAEKILKQKKDYWRLMYSVKTPYKKYLKKFLDSRQDYTKTERRLGRHIRSTILERMRDLIIKAQTRVQKLGLACSGNIGVAVPGSVAPGGSILNSTDYLPFFRKKDGFNFTRSLEELLRKKTLHDYRVYIINDGIAAGMANVYFDFLKTEHKKFAFLGVGSGLGGCVGIIDKR